MLTALIYVAGQEVGGGTAPGYDAGQSGLGEQTMQRLEVTPPTVEDVLIQAFGSDRAFSRDAA